ncbi:MAG: hypothetical protein AB2531_04345, partial [Candidatus Thiodiazotropha sp.]
TRIKQEQEEAERKRYELIQIEQALSTLQATYESKQKVLGAEFESERSELMRKITELKRQAGQVLEQRDAMRDARE